MKRHLTILLFGACGIVALAADKPGNATTVVLTELRKTPDMSAAVTSTIPAQTALVLGERQGGWYRAEYQGKSGWVRMLSVRLSGAGAVSKENALAALAKASSNTQSTVGTGIRGLTEEQLNSAKENLRELAVMEAQSVSADEAQAYAAAGGVRPTKSKE